MSASTPAVVVILAAGEGTRMRSALPKVLHRVAGRALVEHVVTAAAHTSPERVVVVVGHSREQVSAHLAEACPWVTTVVQEEQRGTGHAVRITLEQIGRLGDGPIVVLTGDTPLLTGPTLDALLERHTATQASATVLTAVLEDPTGYGRVVRDAQGMYAFDVAALATALARVTTENAQGEEYLTDVISILRRDGARVEAVVVPDPSEVMGVNDRVQLAQVTTVMRDRINARWMREGVTMLDPSSIWIDVDADIASDVTLLPGTHLVGPTAIASGAVIGPDTTLTACEVGEGATVRHTWAELAVIGAGAVVGPFTYLRPGTTLGVETKAGAFVEIKASTIGDHAKVPHLSYVGDAEIGEGSNIGAATVFVNYDGVEKHRTVIGDHVRVGSDTMLVAPVTIGDGAYTAAGSVITDDVPPGAIGVSRAPQRNVEGWVERRRPGTKSAEAAARARGDNEEDA